MSGGVGFSVLASRMCWSVFVVGVKFGAGNLHLLLPQSHWQRHRNLCGCRGLMEEVWGGFPHPPPLPSHKSLNSIFSHKFTCGDAAPDCSDKSLEFSLLCEIMNYNITSTWLLPDMCNFYLPLWAAEGKIYILEVCYNKERGLWLIFNVIFPSTWISWCWK